jgi:uncharacterized glyoxalase superfamily protein PhnB
MAFATRGLAPLLFVYDMDESITFYRDGLGFTLVATSGPPPIGWAMLIRGDVTIMLNSEWEHGDPRRPTTRPPRRDHKVSLYLGCDDVDAAHAELAARGVAAAPPKTASYGMRQLLITDPDGFDLVLQHPAKPG